MQKSEIDESLAQLCQGNPSAKYKLHAILEGYCDEVINTKNLKDQLKSREDVRKKVATYLAQQSKQGNHFAAAYYGYMLIQGIGTKKSEKEGLSLIKTSADTNNALGQFLLGYYCIYGVEGYKPFTPSVEKGAEYLNKSIAQGWPNSMTLLAKLYKEGEKGFELNIKKANELLRQAAKLGDPGAIELLTRRGEDIHNGWGLNPFIYYTPQHLDFTYELTANKRGYAEADEYSGHTYYTTESIFVTLTHAGTSNAPQIVEKDTIQQKDCDSASIMASQQYKQPGTMMTAQYEEYTQAQKRLSNYFTCKALVRIFAKFDSKLNDLLNQAPQTQTPTPLPRTSQSGQNFPGAFFNPGGNSPAVIQPQVDPGQMLQIMQMLQQNPQFALQVAILHQQFLHAAGVPNQPMLPQYGAQLPPPQHGMQPQPTMPPQYGMQQQYAPK